MSDISMTELEVRKRLLRIDQLIADAVLKYADAQSKNHEFAQSGWKIVISAATTGVAVAGGFAAVGALLARLY